MYWYSALADCDLSRPGSHALTARPSGSSWDWVLLPSGAVTDSSAPNAGSRTVVLI